MSSGNADHRLERVVGVKRGVGEQMGVVGKGVGVKRGWMGEGLEGREGLEERECQEGRESGVERGV